MKNWQKDLLSAQEGLNCEHALFKQIEIAAVALGFEYCAYGLRVPLPLSNPKMIILNNYPVAWQQRYQEQGYLRRDATVLHGQHSQTPIIWSDQVFASVAEMWDEAQAFGLRHGWAQSSCTANGVGGMLTLARSSGPITAEELQSKELRMRWLVQTSHNALTRILAPKLGIEVKVRLTQREVEILKWTADGKTAGEISAILSLSENTVNFHIKNAVAKLDASNKTAAVVRAAMMGFLN
ncbi:LuxR family transcriptional regulator [Chitinimonas arctica]|uniref:LuxR family transcriptional regulator n=1 Tax=Chitinimonas arctica TaxID=2594795 RepID=A0A516SCU6_9NEIS|nr:autoinducer binding domain-containing protein [Chitinimonas arctica]QDQ25972.1 LuxR family transcriptional regulator [Chitinimonas arctica]